MPRQGVPSFEPAQLDAITLGNSASSQTACKDAYETGTRDVPVSFFGGERTPKNE
jgi:hypothetical protein